jgi:ATP sulfurylase
VNYYSKYTMQAILDQFEEAIEILDQQMHEGQSYMERFAAARDVFEEIKKEEEEIEGMRQELA